MDEITQKFELSYWTAMAQNDRKRAELIQQEYTDYRKAKKEYDTDKNAKLITAQSLLNDIETIQNNFENCSSLDSIISAFEKTSMNRRNVYAFSKEKSHLAAREIIASEDCLEDKLASLETPKEEMIIYMDSLNNLKEIIESDVTKLS